MDGVKDIIEASSSHVSLATKILGFWPIRHKGDALSISAGEQADAQSIMTVQAVLTDQVAALIEERPNDPAVLDALVSCGGKFNLDNLAHILRLAAPQLTEDARPDLITDDFAANFKDKAKTCSDPDMADLWAQLIAGEANAPGSYSRKTVNVLADMEPEDARLFRNVSMFRIGGVIVSSNNNYHITNIGPPQSCHLIILDETHAIYGDAGINFVSLNRLEWLGLVTNHAIGYTFTSSELHVTAWLSGDGLFYIHTDKPVIFGQYSFTVAGEELSKLCVPLEAPAGFADYIVATWKSKDIQATRSLSEAIEMGEQAQ